MIFHDFPIPKVGYVSSTGRLSQLYGFGMWEIQVPTGPNPSDGKFRAISDHLKPYD